MTDPEARHLYHMREPDELKSRCLRCELFGPHVGPHDRKGRKRVPK